jgi:hypothetical protein
MDSLPHTHDEYNIVFCLTPGLSYSLRGCMEMLTPGDIIARLIAFFAPPV